MQHLKAIKNGVLVLQKTANSIFHRNGLKAPEIEKRLLTEGMGDSRQGIDQFVKRYVLTNSIGRKEGSGRTSILTETIKLLVEIGLTLLQGILNRRSQPP